MQLLGSCHYLAHFEKELEQQEHRESASDKLSRFQRFDHLDVRYVSVGIYHNAEYQLTLRVTLASLLGVRRVPA